MAEKPTRGRASKVWLLPEGIRDALNAMLRKGMQPDSVGRYPIVYRLDMSHADSLIVGQTFPVKSRDVIYASRHPAVDFAKFLGIVARPVAIAGQTTAMVDRLN